MDPNDTYLRIDYPDVVRAHRASGKPATMTVLRNQGQWDSSNAAFDGRLVRYDKHQPDPGMEWIDYGLAVLTAADMPAPVKKTMRWKRSSRSSLVERVIRTLYRVSWSLGKRAGVWC